MQTTPDVAARPGPAVLLLHMCNADRKSWEPLGPQLAAAGIHALALDYRGYGESGGERFKDDPPKQQKVITEKWPGDADAALAWIGAQPGVDKGRIGAAGGSCGVNQAWRFRIFGHYQMGRVYDLQGRREEALAAYRRVLELPDEHDAHRLAKERIESPATKEQLE